MTFLVWRDTGHPEGGGSEVFVEEISKRLVAAGHQVTILCAAYDGALADEVRDGITFRRRGGRLGVYLHGLAYLVWRGRRDDVVVDVQNGLPFFSPLVRRRAIVVLLHHVHREQWHLIYPGWRGRIGWWLESRVSPRLYRRRRYVTVSEASRADMTALGISADRINIVHNGIDVPHPTRSLARNPNPTLCVLGRLVPHKQVEHAFEVAAAIRSTFADVQVDVIGAGWWRQELEERAIELGVRDLVNFHGYVDEFERGRILDRSWLMLAPSVKEGWGIAIMEAASRGVPAIAYRGAGGVGESIQDLHTGRLVEDIDELIKVTSELLSETDQRERLGAAARRRAQDFDWDESAKSSLTYWTERPELIGVVGSEVSECRSRQPGH